jgi:hypothetical protein
MTYGDFIIEFDKTRFPLIRKSDWNYSISLFPVSKYQFEQFMVDNGPIEKLYTNEWYKKLLEFNQRTSWKRFEEKKWELFITGMSMDEIKPFLKYFGKNFRLPKVREWKELFMASNEILRMKPTFRELCKGSSAPPVSLWIENGLFPLVSEGLLEIVYDNCQQYIGRPWQRLWANAWNPETTRSNVSLELFQKAVGFRVVKSMEEV